MNEYDDQDKQAPGLCNHVGIRCTDCITDAVEAAVSAAEARHAEAIYIIEAKHQRWITETTAKAHEYADENNLCDAFDRFMVSVGLEPRTKNFRVSVSVTVDIDVPIEARDEDAAKDAVDSYSVVQAARSRLSEWGADHWDVTEVDED
jgi:hypothetical protein